MNIINIRLIFSFNGYYITTIITNRYNIGKCKSKLGYSDTADMLQSVSATFHRQMEYYNIDVDDMKEKDEDYLQKCIFLLFGNYLVIEHKQYFRLICTAINYLHNFYIFHRV